MRPCSLAQLGHALTLLCAFLVSVPAGAAPPRPTLVLDAGGHTDRVNQVLFTPDGQRLVSVSADKSIRLWDVATGEALGVLRPPAGRGPEGMLFTAAVSPDGRLLAVGGYPLGAGQDGHPVYLITLPGGPLQTALRGHTDVIHGLAFSPDGKWLASASADGTARIWDVARGECRRVLRGHSDVVYAAAFAPDGSRLATASQDGTARLWSWADGRTESVLRGHTRGVRCVAWRPDGQALATGGLDQAIRLWDAAGALGRSFAELQSEITSVTFTPDGRRLLFTRGAGDSKVCSFLDLATGAEAVRFAHHDNSVRTGAVSPDGTLAATGGGEAHEIYLWKTADGTLVHRLAGKGRRQLAAGWSADGQAVAWGSKAHGEPTRPETVPLERAFVLDELELRTASGNYRRAQIEAGGLRLAVVQESAVAVRQGERTLAQWQAPLPDERVLCVSLLSDGRAAVGTDFGLYLFRTRDGMTLASLQGHTGPVWAVAPSPDGRLLLSASSDQTVRLWRLDRVEPLLSLFVAGADWIAWTPEGYYAASPGGERLVGWQTSNGPTALASFHAAAQFRASLYRPDVVRHLPTAGSLTQALRQADAERGQVSERTEIARVLPPQVAIAVPRERSLRVTESRLKIEANAQSVGSHPVGALRLLLDGRPYRGEESLRVVPTPRSGTVHASWEVELAPGANRLCVQAVSTVSRALSEEVIVHFAPSGEARSESDLYVLAIGIDAYPGPNRLECAVADARALTRLLEKQTGNSLYHRVQVRLLTDNQARRQEIRSGMRWLNESMRPADLAVLFYAGHGIRDARGTFYLLPTDVEPRDLSRTALSEEELKQSLVNLPGRVLLLLDACHAGKIGEIDVIGPRQRAFRAGADDLMRELAADEVGVVVMCAARGREESAEDPRLGHGYFTQALLEGLAGKADYSHKGIVRLTALDNYVSERVRELSNGNQTACTAKSTRTGSFPIVLVKP